MSCFQSFSWLHPLLGLLLAPLLPGVINRTKAFYAGRKGQPLLQLYFDLWKLFQKGAVYSQTTSWVFKAGPTVGFSTTVMALLLAPMGETPALFKFNGDLIVMCYLMGIVRFFTVTAALDTGSAFEGMGASREVQFSIIAEPTLLLCLAAMAQAAGTSTFHYEPVSRLLLSLTSIYSHLTFAVWERFGIVLLLIASALFVVLLTECSRIPVDDPNTHLELTMIHEVMILDHSGPDFGMILYGASLKLWILLGLLSGLLVPVRSGYFIYDTAAFLAGIFLLAGIVGTIESSMARLRLLRVPQLLTGAGVLSLLALALVLRGYG